MESEISAKRISRTAIISGFTIYLVLVSHFLGSLIIKNQILNNSEIVIAKNMALMQQTQTGEPVNLKIPAINVDSFVVNVGLAADGAMDVPKNTKEVGWFKLGQRPGENGSAVIAGHYGVKKGKGSVFDDLYKLRKGDKLYIEDGKGMIISFVVRESRRYDPKADASEVFGSTDGKPHLNLITCEGTWNKALGGYSKRLVVFTDKE